MPEGEGLESSFASRTAVLADAQGLLTCYGVGEDGSANLPHAVVELCFTSSVRFLQPGLLLKVRVLLESEPQKLQGHGASWRQMKFWQWRAIKASMDFKKCRRHFSSVANQEAGILPSRTMSASSVPLACKGQGLATTGLRFLCDMHSATTKEPNVCSH